MCNIATIAAVLELDGRNANWSLKSSDLNSFATDTKSKLSSLSWYMTEAVLEHGASRSGRPNFWCISWWRTNVYWHHITNHSVLLFQANCFVRLTLCWNIVSPKYWSGSHRTCRTGCYGPVNTKDVHKTSWQCSITQNLNADNQYLH